MSRSVREAAPIAPDRAVRDVRGVLDRGDLHERLRNQRPRQRRRHRIARIRQGAGLERRQHDVARELLARVDDVRAGRAGQERLRSNLAHVARLPEIERDGDHFRTMTLSEP